jgi:hypothetical protein
MGWLFMPTLGSFDTPKDYLTDQFTYENDHKISTVLASATVAMRTWYAACRQVDKVTGETEIFAIVCLVSYNRRAKDGMIFGYKDMTEHMGPCEAQCPVSILNLLGPTSSEHALAWRQRCRDYRAKQARPSPKHGDTIVFAAPISFVDGFAGSRFRVVKRGRQTIFMFPETHGCYRISDWKCRAWTTIPAIDVSRVAA